MQQFKLKKIAAKNFRNLQSLLINISGNIICFFGENAQGKTNILEMIYFLFHQKSFKKKVDFPQLVAIDGDKPEIFISAEFINHENNYISIKHTENNIEYYLNNQKIKKTKEYQSVFILVPVDSYNFFNDRSERINWLDKEIGRFNKVHTKALINYSRGLRQRNLLLASSKINQLQIKTLTETLAKYAIEIQKNRIEYINDIKDYLKITFQRLFNSADSIGIEYTESLKSSVTEQEYGQKWLEYLPLEVNKKISKFGPQLDELVITLNGFPMNVHGSMGQQKMAYFSLFFASIKYLNGPKKLEFTPIILLDDISSEIDSLRWKSLIKYLLDQNFQVFLTTANLTFLESLKVEKNVDIFKIENGVVNKNE
jgi:DNA replication and repair protein RecF